MGRDAESGAVMTARFLFLAAALSFAVPAFAEEAAAPTPLEPIVSPAIIPIEEVVDETALPPSPGSGGRRASS